MSANPVQDTFGLDPQPCDTRAAGADGPRLIKTFGRVVGLDGVDLDLYPGEVLAIIGDNGAGKSTLIKALTGALTADSGEVFLDGQPVALPAPRMDARNAGIETVYQTLAVAPALDIAATCSSAAKRRRPGPLGSSSGCSTRRA